VKTLSINEPFNLVFPLKTADADVVLEELKEHGYDVTTTEKKSYLQLSVLMDNFVQAELFINLVLSMITDHNDLLLYIRQLND